MRRALIVATLCLSALGLSFQARAEVRAVTDRDGNYVMTRVLLDQRLNHVWSPLSRGSSNSTLNPEGDQLGDLYPTIGEAPLAPYYPWVVWSRIRDGRYDLAWSRWTEGGWEPIRWVEPGHDRPGHNLDVDLAFDADGRPYIVWWREHRGVGSVYLSMFLSSTWMAAYGVSDDGLDSRYPQLEVASDGVVVVRYTTPAGIVEQEITFDLPVTITDDINPLDYVETGAASVVDEED